MENVASAVAAWRTLPRQGRAQVTFSRIENSIRTLLADPDVGRDRFTASEVAALAGVSIGTLYRYFPSRLAMLDHVWPNRGSTYLPEEAPREMDITASFE
jgi:AcrR family transcriptional regulator